MSYRLRVTADKPTGLWMLDGSLVDSSGLSTTAIAIGGITDYMAPLVPHVEKSSIITDTKQVKFPSRFFKPGWENVSFSLEAWVFNPTSSTELMSHTGSSDGLSVVNGEVAFTIKFTNSTKSIKYKADTIKNMHVVGVYTPDNMTLYINGRMHQRINFDLKDTFAAVTDSGYLYAGKGGSTAMNAAAIYEFPLSVDQIMYHYQSGRNTVNPDNVAQMYGGQNIDITDNSADVFLRETFGPRMSWALGKTDTLMVNDLGQLTQKYENDEYLAGVWTYAFDASYHNDMLYAVKLAWEGEGNYLVEASNDGNNWVTVANNQFVPLNSAYVDNMLIRVTFVEGDNAHLDLLEIVGLASEKLTVPNRNVVNVAGTFRDKWAPMTYRVDQGLYIGPGLYTSFYPKASEADKTWEFWYYSPTGSFGIDPLSGFHEDGKPASPGVRAGQWHMIHVTDPSAILAMSFAGTIVIGRLAVYPTVLTDAEILEIFKMHTGSIPVPVSVSDAVAIPSTSVKLYSSDWTISAAG